MNAFLVSMRNCITNYVDWKPKVDCIEFATLGGEDRDWHEKRFEKDEVQL